MGYIMLLLYVLFIVLDLIQQVSCFVCLLATEFAVDNKAEVIELLLCCRGQVLNLSATFPLSPPLAVAVTILELAQVSLKHVHDCFVANRRRIDAVLADARTYIRTCVRVYARTYVRTYVRAYVFTYIHLYVHP